MLSSVDNSGTTGTARVFMNSVLGGIQWGLDRMLCVAYGVVYDYIFERFHPYQDLQKEVRRLVEITTPETVDRRQVRVLDVGCGLGNFTLCLAEAGFSVIGLDTYGALVELAREKRRAKRLANLAFRYGDLAEGASFREGTFDHLVTIHSLYVHPAPERLLSEAYRVLKPGGHAIFVNHTRQVGLWPTLRELTHREGLKAALRCLVWLVPNAIFEVARRRIGPHYWSETEFRARLQEAGFTVLDMRRTFLNGASLLVWARKSRED